MSDKVVVYEIFKREDGSVSGVGGSYEMDAAKADEAVASGKYKYADKPVGGKPKAKKKKAGDEVDG